MGKWELTMEPVQEWGEEHEDGAVFGVTLRREPVQQPAESTEAFVRYRTCKVRRLKAATLDRLVSHLLDPCCQEQDYGRILLSTYHTFTSSNKLIETLFQRDHLASELHSIKYTKSSLWTSLQMWLEEFSEDFRDPPMHSSLRLMSLQLRGYTALFPLAKRFEALLKKFQAEDVVASGSTDHAEHPDLDQRKDLDHLSTQTYFMDFSVTDVAEQLTRMDAELFMKVIPFQCLGCVWSQRDKKENLSPTIWATIAQFNAVTNLVITSLLCPSYNLVPPLSPASRTTHRARVIEKWVRVAQGCRELKNFSSLWAILSALQSNPIYRLKKTWAAVSRETMSVFENLCETFPDENCVLTSRDIFVDDGSQSNTDNTTATKASKRCHLTRQMSTSGGTVPYLGTYLTALTMLDTALPDVVEGGLINFEKRRRECEILRQIQQLQASCCQYVLTNHPKITAWIQNQTLLTDQESYELSRQLEASHDSSPSSNSGWNHRALTKKLSSLLTGNDGSKKNADQISLSSSGSSSSELEEMSASQTLKLMTPSLSGCGQNRTEASPSYSRPSSSSGSQQDLSPSSSASPDSHLVSGHKRSASMTSLAFYNRQVDDSCIIRVSMEFCNNGNMYKSLLLTSQDKTAHVIQRALQKHNLEDVSEQEFTLVQLLDQGRELHIPEKANVFYAMSTSANYDFVLRKCPKGQRKHLTRSVSLSSGRSTK